MEWVKALHVISIIAWMAGLLYLPRLFVYHASAEVGSIQSETFKVMERRLYRAIMTPAMATSWIFGLWLGWGNGYFSGWETWFAGKLVFVVLLSGVHLMLGKQVRRFAADSNRKSGRYFRILNEVPTVLMIVIVVAVIVRPFSSG